MQKTTTFLMFSGESFGKAEEAIAFYTSLFSDSEIKQLHYFKKGEPGGKEGAVKHATFTLNGQEYMAIDSLGHAFTFTPSTSIYVNCDSEEEILTLYSKLLDGGKAMMPIGHYGFSEKFAWVADRYGFSWQLNFGALTF
jgi:predicted 3-demethylubiquinone-9 3-methyltransferase (glyoxalase superfamily)